MALPEHRAGPFDKKFREYEQPWHIRKFDSVREDILELEPDILNDKPRNEQVPSLCPCASTSHSSRYDTGCVLLLQNKYLAHTVALLEQVSDNLFGAKAVS